MRGNSSDLLDKIADGDWSDEVQDKAHEAVKHFAENFGFDLDEEGQPLEDEDEVGGRDSSRGEGSDDSGDSDSDSGDSESDDERSGDREKEKASA